jgi:predicted transcriptional regulator
MIPPIEVSSEANASAALSLVAVLIRTLVGKGILTKDETIDLYESLAKAKQAMADTTKSRVEAEAAALLDYIAAHLKEKL